MKIAFIGLGNMGAGMAANLVKAGHAVNAFDLSADALANARASGCTPFTSAADAVLGVEAVVTMLPNGGIVDAVYRDDVFGKAPQGAILVDCSTIDIATARRVITRAQDAGYDMVDAPVSGGIAAANAGTLAFMVGGTQGAFLRAQEVLGPMGKAVIHAGAAGAGQTAKICNNMLLAIHMIGTCEAFVMAQKLGLDAQKFFDIASISSGQNWSMTSYCPVPGVGPVTPADRDYEGGFATALMLKDLKLAMQGAAEAGVDAQMGALAERLYAGFADAGNAGLDFSAIIKTL